MSDGYVQWRRLIGASVFNILAPQILLHESDWFVRVTIQARVQQATCLCRSQLYLAPQLRSAMTDVKFKQSPIQTATVAVFTKAPVPEKDIDDYDRYVLLKNDGKFACFLFFAKGPCDFSIRRTDDGQAEYGWMTHRGPPDTPPVCMKQGTELWVDATIFKTDSFSNLRKVTDAHAVDGTPVFERSWSDLKVVMAKAMPKPTPAQCAVFGSVLPTKPVAVATAASVPKARLTILVKKDGTFACVMPASRGEHIDLICRKEKGVLYVDSKSVEIDMFDNLGKRGTVPKFIAAWAGLQVIGKDLSGASTNRSVSAESGAALDVDTTYMLKYPASGYGSVTVSRLFASKNDYDVWVNASVVEVVDSIKPAIAVSAP